VNPQELVDRYHGTGNVWWNQQGEWNNREYLSMSHDIGVTIDKDTGIASLTDRIAIHYSKTGTHVVPVKRRPW